MCFELLEIAGRNSHCALSTCMIYRKHCKVDCCEVSGTIAVEGEMVCLCGDWGANFPDCNIHPVEFFSHSCSLVRSSHNFLFQEDCPNCLLLVELPCAVCPTHTFGNSVSLFLHLIIGCQVTP